MVDIVDTWNRLKPVKLRNHTSHSGALHWLIVCVCVIAASTQTFNHVSIPNPSVLEVDNSVPVPRDFNVKHGPVSPTEKGICHDKTPARCHECHDPKGGQNKNSKSKNYYKQTNSIYVTNCNIDLCKQTPNFNLLDLESGLRHLLKDFVDWRTAAWVSRREWEEWIPWDHQGQVKAWRCLEFREQ